MIKRPVIKDRRLALLGGYGALILGSALLYDAYENRGRTRPWLTRFAPGP